MEKTAKPIQARSQKTKEKLLTAAITMYAKNGYHSTTVDEIAAEAGVSTGIAYRYFRNKKDLLLSALEFASKSVRDIVSLDSIDSMNDNTDFRKYIDTVLRSFEDIHDRFHDIHEELEGLQHTDEDVRKFYAKVSHDMMENVIEKLSHFLPDHANIREKAYLAVSLLEQYCHLKMNSDQINLDFSVLREKTIDTVMMVLNGR
ncbi:MAG: HTH-type transcriptional regulator MtrR [Firmicutes bacterium ADurb.BinA205]|nr:MAG: HTH-type transcriptional regulator MtrR [Firmicutes bacterium ADurb.BinA205]